MYQQDDDYVLISIHGAYPKILIGKEEGKAGSVFRPLNTSHSSGAASSAEEDSHGPI